MKKRKQRGVSAEILWTMAVAYKKLWPMLRTYKIVVSPGWENFLSAGGLDSVETVYRLESGERFTRSSSTEVRRVVLDHGEKKRTVFIKKYWANNFRQLWSGALRGTFFGRSKARCEFENLALLRQCGLDAPAPVAYGEERRARWLTRSFLISEGVPEPLPLDVFIRDVLRDKPETEQCRLRRELVEHLADYTRRMHEHRFVHHDYFWRNIILTGQSLGHFALIDAHKGKRWPARAEQENRAKDLATLDSAAPRFFRRTERLRFFLRYLQHGKLNQEDKGFVRRILRLAEPQRELQIRRVIHDRTPTGSR